MAHMLVKRGEYLIYSLTDERCFVCSGWKQHMACVSSVAGAKKEIYICLDCTRALYDAALNMASKVGVTVPLIKVPTCQFCDTIEPAYFCASCGHYSCFSCWHFDNEGNCIHKHASIVVGHDWNHDSNQRISDHLDS